MAIAVIVQSNDEFKLIFKGAVNGETTRYGGEVIEHNIRKLHGETIWDLTLMKQFGL